MEFFIIPVLIVLVIAYRYSQTIFWILTAATIIITGILLIFFWPAIFLYSILIPREYSDNVNYNVERKDLGKALLHLSELNDEKLTYTTYDDNNYARRIDNRGDITPFLWDGLPVTSIYFSQFNGKEAIKLTPSTSDIKINGIPCNDSVDLNKKTNVKKVSYARDDFELFGCEAYNQKLLLDGQFIRFDSLYLNAQSKNVSDIYQNTTLSNQFAQILTQVQGVITQPKMQIWTINTYILSDSYFIIDENKVVHAILGYLTTENPNSPTLRLGQCEYPNNILFLATEFTQGKATFQFEKPDLDGSCKIQHLPFTFTPLDTETGKIKER
ncbi:hypothetical protein [Glaesserella sp.]|uniref:hypothetical protein n=1 Tax=Glaesserella sp. TaxID=2094731 RepID=UPI0035A010D2